MHPMGSYVFDELAREDEAREIASLKRSDRAVPNQQTLAWLRNAVSGFARPKIADYGCGAGGMAARIAAELPHARVVGFEPSTKLLALARETHMRENLSFEPCRPFEPLATHAESCHVVFCRLVLQHVPTPDRTLDVLKHMLVPGGSIMLEDIDASGFGMTPKCPGFESIWHQVQNARRRRGGDLRIGGKLEGLALAAGFKNVTVFRREQVTGPIEMMFVGDYLERWLGQLDFMLANMTLTALHLHVDAHKNRGGEYHSPVWFSVTATK